MLSKLIKSRDLYIDDVCYEFFFFFYFKEKKEPEKKKFVIKLRGFTGYVDEVKYYLLYHVCF